MASKRAWDLGSAEAADRNRAAVPSKRVRIAPPTPTANAAANGVHPSNTPKPITTANDVADGAPLDWVAKRQDITYDSSPYSTRHQSSSVRLLNKSKAADNMLWSEVERCEFLKCIRRHWGFGLCLELDEMLGEPAYFGEEITRGLYVGLAALAEKTSGRVDEAKGVLWQVMKGRENRELRVEDVTAALELMARL